MKTKEMRRYLAQKIALKRWKRFHERRGSPIFGYFFIDKTPKGIYRKWNGACGCAMCRADRPKYNRRRKNGLDKWHYWN